MLTIRRDQLDALRAPAVHELVLELVTHIKHHFPAETAGESDEDLYARVKATLHRAEKYGMQGKRDAYRYVDVSMLYGADFDERPVTAWTVDFLTDEDVSSPSQRMNRLFDEVSYRLEVEESNARVRGEFYGASE